MYNYYVELNRLPKKAENIIKKITKQKTKYFHACMHTRTHAQTYVIVAECCPNYLFLVQILTALFI